jgi:GxxExxY protein
VNGCVLLELKAVKSLDPAHQAQLLNYLKATGLKVGLILNFGSPRLAVKRMML